MFNSTKINTLTKDENIDNILENETQQNKNDSWNKLNKTVKIHKLHEYAEKYSTDQKYSEDETRKLKHFFVESLERGKLLKTKEVNYNKNTQQIIDIQGLFYHTSNHKFTLKSMDNKRVSTLKSLTPKRSNIPNGSKVVLLDNLNPNP